MTSGAKEFAIEKRSPENSLVGAKAYEILLRQRLSHGDRIDGREEQEIGLPKFGDFSEQWYNTYVMTNNKLSEQRCKRFTLNTHLIPFFGTKRLDQITSQQVEEYKASRVQMGLKPKTINNHLTILGKCLRTAQEWIDEKLPCPRIRFLKVPPQPYDTLSAEECQLLLNTIDKPRWWRMVLLALQTGMRIGELIGLQWLDIDFGAKTLTVRHSVVRGVIGTTKSNRERHIPLASQMCQLLGQMERLSCFVFSDVPSKPLDYNYARDVLQSYCKKAGLRTIGWHTMRHTFASQLASQGVPLQAVQGLLGHSEIKMTMRYAHLAPSALREAIQVFEIPTDKNFGHQVGNTIKPFTTPVIQKAPSIGLIRENFIGAGNGN